MERTTTLQPDPSIGGRMREGRVAFPPGSVASAVSWASIAAGAAAAAALSLLLLILGVGLGLSSVSPWAQQGVSATTFGMSTILWLTVTQLLASAMGGYLAGRLRTKWIEVHTDEVYFRDTAHGFLAWALASLATAVLLSSTIASIVGGGVQTSASAMGGVVHTANAVIENSTGSARTMPGDDAGSMGYFVEALFRRDLPGASGGSVAPSTIAEPASLKDTAEVGRIFANTHYERPLPAEDVRYIGQLVSQRTGLSRQDAEKRVSDVYTHAIAKVRDAEVAAREATDRARKASAYGALWLFVSLLVGAFAASLAATWGGRQRDA